MGYDTLLEGAVVTVNSLKRVIEKPAMSTALLYLTTVRFSVTRQACCLDPGLWVCKESFVVAKITSPLRCHFCDFWPQSEVPICFLKKMWELQLHNILSNISFLV